MFLKLAECLSLCFLLSAARSQRIWGSSGGAFNSGFSSSWNPNYGFSGNSNKPSPGGANNAVSWGSEGFGFGGRPEEALSSAQNEKKLNWGLGSGWNQGRPGEVSGGTSAGWRPNGKETGSAGGPQGPSTWKTDSSGLPSRESNNQASASWGAPNGGKPSTGQSAGQNSRPGGWYSNNLDGNKPNENEILTESDYEDNSMYPSWGSDNKKKKKPVPTEGLGNWESTTQRNYKNSGTSKWDTSNNSKPQKAPGPDGWSSNGSPQAGKERPLEGTSGQNEKPSALDTSILDELDKNDWYFGDESNYPKPPFRDTLNIDVSELWNFDKNKKSNQNPRGNSDNSSNNRNSDKNKSKKNNNSRRWNRETEGAVAIQCECVSVNLCDEEDMIITQDDVKFDSRPLEEFRCEKPTDVCCTNPKMTLSSRGNVNPEREQLRCGERRFGGKQFPGLGDDVAEPGEFPWTLRMENGEIGCGASLIHRSMALTAAHCVSGARPGDLALLAGVWNSDGEPSQRRTVAKIILHPDYDSRNPRNDIALLILETAFELTDNVNTICLPVTNDKWDSGECVVAGWRQDRIHGQVLEKGLVRFLPQPECQSIMLVTDLWRNYVLHDSFVCGLEKTGKQSCTGDDGGFVICPSKKKPATYVQIGIVSKGMNCDEFGRPGIFTNLLHFLDWINKNHFEFGLFDDIDIRSLKESQ